LTLYRISYIIILVKGPRPRTRGPVAVRGVAADPNRRARCITYKLNKRHLTLHRGLDILDPVAMPKGIIQFEGVHGMERTKNMVYRPSIESRELTLYATNDGRLYDYRIVPVVRNLAKKFAKGTFNPDKAIDAFYPVATEAAKKYCREFARVEDAPRIFSVTDRFTTAADMVEYYMENIERNDL